MAKSKSRRKGRATTLAKAHAQAKTIVAEREKRSADPTSGYYPTKRDMRFRLAIWLIILGLVGPTVTLLWQQGGSSWWLGTLLFTVAMMTVWSVQSMHYRLETGRLLIAVGPYRREIALPDIRSVTMVRNAAPGPALSLDRLSIVYSDKGKEETVLISPNDRDAFIKELSQFDRGLKKTDGGLQRR